MKYLKYTQEQWSEGDTATKFVGTVYDDNERTQETDINGLDFKVDIVSDPDSIEQFSKIGDKTTGSSFEFNFDNGEIPAIGEWKLEVYLVDENGDIVDATHHDDFEVIA